MSFGGISWAVKCNVPPVRVGRAMHTQTTAASKQRRDKFWSTLIIRDNVLNTVVWPFMNT